MRKEKFWSKMRRIKKIKGFFVFCCGSAAKVNLWREAKWWCTEYHESCSIIEISPALPFQRPHRSCRQAVSHHQTSPPTQLIMVSQMFKCVTNTQQIKRQKHEEGRKLGFRLYIDTQIQTHKVHKNLFNCSNRNRKMTVIIITTKKQMRHFLCQMKLKI